MDQMFNTSTYTVPQIVVFGIGCALWALLYLILIRNYFRYRFIEMPLAAAASNFAWEFLWAYVFTSDMGRFVETLNRIWFVLDIVIFWAVLHVGVKQLGIERLKRQFVPLMLFMLVAFGFGYYYFGKEGYDTATGLTSGLMANLIISGLYPVIMLRQPSLYGISPAVGWLKMVGTGLITVFTFMFFPEGHGFIKSMGLAVLVMDLYYLYLLYDRMRRDAAAEQATAATA